MIFKIIFVILWLLSGFIGGLIISYDISKDFDIFTVGDIFTLIVMASMYSILGFITFIIILLSKYGNIIIFRRK